MKKKLAYLMLGIALVSSIFTGCGERATSEKELQSTTTENDVKNEMDNTEADGENTENKDKIKVIGDGDAYLHDNGILYAAYENNIYKYDIATSEKEEIVSGERIETLFLVDEWIYYDDYNCICKIKNDGTEYTCLLEVENPDLEAVYNGNIYFTGEIDKTRGLHSMKFDGSDIALVHKDVYDLYDVAIRDDNMYYACNKGVCKINSVNKRETILSVSSAQMWFDDEYIYTVSYEETEDMYVEYYQIKRANLDGTDKKVLFEKKVDVLFGDSIEIIGVSSGWIYFLTEDDNDNICEYKMTITGEELQKSYLTETTFASMMISDDDIVHFITCRGNLYCATESGKVGRLAVASNEKIDYTYYIDKEIILYSNITSRYSDRVVEEIVGYDYYYYIINMDGTNKVEVYSKYENGV